MDSSRELNSKRSLKSGTKRAKGLPRRAQDMSKEELLLTLQKKRECNSRALKIVEGMLESCVEVEWFLGVLHHINQSHFQDVTEERAISKLCGYPICSNELNDIPSQQYCISTQLNKVYDIQERKNFCSNKCYRASKYIKDQMYTSPLWLRDIEPKVNFSLMPSTKLGGGAGIEVNVDVQRITKDEINQMSNEKNSSLKQNEYEAASLSTEVLDPVQSVEACSSMCSSLFSKRRRKYDLDKSIPQDEIKVKLEQKIICSEGGDIKSTVDRNVAEKVSNQKEKENIPKLSSDGIGFHIPQSNKDAMDSSEEAGLQRSRNINVAALKVTSLPCSKGTTTNQNHESFETVSLKSNSIEPKKEPNVVDNLVSSDLYSEVQESINPADCGPDGGVTKFKNAISNIKNDVACIKVKQANKSKKISLDVKSKQQSMPVPCKALTTVSHVENCVQEWFTMETMCYLFGETALKDMLEQKGESIQEHYKALRSVTWDQEKHERFLAICKRLSLIEMEDCNFDSKVVKNDTEIRRKPLPDYTALKKEAETMELKIRAFYKGQLEIDEKKVSFAEDVKNEPSDSKDEAPQIPLVHLHSQRALRKKIVLDGLNRVLPDFLRTFGMSHSTLIGSVRGLISTFALTSTNITFKPQEWSLLGLIIIKLLTLREPDLKKCLQHEQSNTYMTLMLMSYKQEPGYLDRLLSWLTDIDKLLAKPQSFGQM